MAAEFVRRNVGVIAAGAPPAALAAKAATTTIPIVFVVGFDPVRAGLVAWLRLPRALSSAVRICPSTAYDNVRHDLSLPQCERFSITSLTTGAAENALGQPA